MLSIPEIPPGIPTDPAVFLSSETGRKWAQSLATAYPHIGYSRDRSDVYSLAECDTFAAAVIDAKREGAAAMKALHETIKPNHRLGDTWHYCVKDDLRNALHERFSDDELEECWADAIYPEWREMAACADTSSPGDMLGSYDYCQILFRFTQGTYLEDTLIASHKSWSDFGELAITSDLQFALNNLGYTVGQYRKASGNKHDPYHRLSPKKPRRNPIISLSQLEELVENACSQYFHFYLFAIVPIHDVIDIDLNEPITFDKAWVATANCFDGTFHDVPASGPVTVNPQDGALISGGHMRYSPDAVCGLSTRHYHARIRNPNTNVA